MAWRQVPQSVVLLQCVVGPGPLSTDIHQAPFRGDTVNAMNMPQGTFQRGHGRCHEGISGHRLEGKGQQLVPLLGHRQPRRRRGQNARRR